MKTTSAGIRKESIASVCCHAGFTKMVIPLEEYIVRMRGGAAGNIDWKGYWIPVQTCASCGKECEVEYQKPD